ncbi:hypothetical protein SLEP1_g43995 [Rubroshorea leprosula]|uniref:Non-haem dioxygenase N-terminal domain-containing protein n=1 Tax=Rubroshorea leprosula TaxID=152421 RepID=A0AAV5LEU8_9ROSI|nr:hypothetical protein SLEP1_g43995 [Rubroshorea leprosula]
MGSESQAPKLPVLDFTKGNLKPGTESWLSACKNVRKALEEYGCFIVEYDKFPSDHRSAVFSAMEELFDLATETK